jgi:hypothetical protein
MAKVVPRENGRREFARKTKSPGENGGEKLRRDLTCGTAIFAACLLSTRTVRKRRSNAQASQNRAVRTSCLHHFRGGNGGSFIPA